MSETDLQLLARYQRERSESAFSELVRRHVDLVYSAALRQVRSPQLAEDVAQSVFSDLSLKAPSLAPNTLLTGWLYRVTHRTSVDVIRRESRRQAREQIAVEMNAANEKEAAWEQIGPLLDEAMYELDETDRAAVLLRYFENKSLREVGQTLGTSEDAAQKRISRAIDKLKAYFSKRGAVIGSGGLATILSTYAIQCAPVGLAAPLAAKALLAGGAVAATSLTLFTMTTLNKAVLVGALGAAALSGGLFLEHQQNQRLRADLTALREKSVKAREADADASATQAGSNADSKAEESQRIELLRLRGQVALLRSQLASAPSNTTPRLKSAAEIQQATDEPQTKMQVSATMNAHVPTGSTLVSGGWVREPGKHIFMLSTPTRLKEEDSIDLQSRLIEVSDEVWGQIGWDALRADSKSDFQGILDEAQTEALLNQMKAKDKVDILTTPRIITANGREAMVSVGDSPVLDDNLWIHFVPNVSASGNGIDLVVKLNIPSKDQKAPAAPTRQPDGR